MTKEDVIEILERFVIGAKPCSQREIIDACASAYRMLKEQPLLPANLDEAAEKHVKGYHPAIQKMCMEEFVAGAEWAQQMKEVCGFQNETYTGSVDTISHIPGPRKLADSDEDEHTVSSLDSAAEEYAVGLNLSGYVRVIQAFKAGAEWMAGQGWIDDGTMPPETKQTSDTMQGHREWTESALVLAYDSVYGYRIDWTRNGRWVSETRGGFTGQVCHNIIAWRPLPEYKEK